MADPLPATNPIPFIHPLFCFVGRESGLVMAMRNNGDELLFASRDNAPLRWVKVGDVNADPKGIAPVEMIEE